MLELLDGVLCYSEDELNQETGVRQFLAFLGGAARLGKLACARQLT